MSYQSHTIRNYDPIVVLVTEGKNDSVDRASLRFFRGLNPEQDAQQCCNEINDNQQRKKHWRKAEIIRENQIIELLPP